MIEEIKSRQNPKVKYANQLKDAGFARKSGKFLVESEHLIEMAKDHQEFKGMAQEALLVYHDNQKKKLD